MLTVPSPHMDDYVYYVKASTRGVELLLALAVVSGGFYESVALDREWSLLNTMVLLCHCYFNIYTRISQGWASYLARRETSARLDTLQTATQAQLDQHGDVCSICYQDMEAPLAVVTQCMHYFHMNCLKRRLVVQDNCPLCTKAIVAGEKEEVNLNSPDKASESNLGSETDDSLDSLQDEIDNMNVDIDQVVNEEVHSEIPNSSELRQKHVGNLFDGD